jgi:2-polyprenyl-3-methyl-5-hydroxy-6-metoxy-1,4-benzoquinol methylase
MSATGILDDAQFSYYTVETGLSDEKRLTMLNKLYNPNTTRFLLESGLKPGMVVAEVGCGCGELACWIADQVAPGGGKVFAIDKDAEQLEVANSLAQRRGITNIIFEQMCLKDLANYSRKFDLIYSRWVLMYLISPAKGVETMAMTLKDDGIIVCEDVDFSNHSIFSFPKTDILNRWIYYWTKNFEILNLKKIDFFNDVYLTMKKLHLRDFKLATNQPILTSEDEKSTLRLGMTATKASILSNKAATEEEYLDFLNAAEEFEKLDSVIGFVRNMLISARRPS